jgi:WD40 repeat protein
MKTNITLLLQLVFLCLAVTLPAQAVQIWKLKSPGKGSVSYDPAGMSSDGNFLAFTAVTYEGPNYMVLDVRDKAKPLDLSKIAPERANALVFHPQKPLLAVVPEKGSEPIRIIDLEQKKVEVYLPKIKRRAFGGSDLYFHPDGNRLWVLSDATLTLYDIKTQASEITVRLAQSAPNAYMTSFAQHPEARLGVVIVHENRKDQNHYRLLLLDFESRKVMELDEQTFPEDQGVWTKSAFLDHGGLYYSIYNQTTKHVKVYTWEPGNFIQKKVTTLPNCRFPAISSDGNYLAAMLQKTEYSAALCVQNLHTGRLDTLDEWGVDAHRLDFFPGGSCLFLNSYNPMLYDLVEGKFHELSGRDQESSGPLQFAGYRERDGRFFIWNSYFDESTLYVYSGWPDFPAFGQRVKGSPTTTPKDPPSAYIFPPVSPLANINAAQKQAGTQLRLQESDKQFGAVRLEKKLFYESALPKKKETSGFFALHGLQNVLFSQDEQTLWTFFSTEGDGMFGNAEIAEWDLSKRSMRQNLKFGDDTGILQPEGFLHSPNMTLKSQGSDLLLLTDSFTYQLDFKQGTVKKHKDGGWVKPEPKTARAARRNISASAHGWDPLIELSGEVTGQIFTPDLRFGRYTWPTFCAGDSILAAVQCENATNEGQKQLCFFDVQFRRLLATVALGDVNISQCLYLPGARRLVLCQSDGAILFWDLDQLSGTLKTNIDAPGQRINLIPQTGHHNPVSALAFSSAGRWLASGSTDGQVLLWDLRADLHRAPLIAKDAVEHLWFSPDDRYLVVQTSKEVQLWSPETAKMERVFDAFETFYQPAANTLLVALNSAFDTVQLWRPGNADAPYKKVKLPTANQWWAFAALSPDCRYLLMTDFDQNIMYDLKNAKIVWEKTDESYTTCSAFDETGRYLILGKAHGWVEVYDVEKKKMLHRFFTGCLVQNRLSLPNGPIVKNRMDYDTSGRMACSVQSLMIKNGQIITGGQFGNLGIWDLKTGKLLQHVEYIDPAPAWMYASPSYNTEYNPVNALALDPAKNMLASATDRASIRLWKMPECKPLRTLKGKVNSLSAAIFHPTANAIIVASDNTAEGLENVKRSAMPADTTLKVWHFTPHGIRLETLDGSVDWVTALMISPDGEQVTAFDRAGWLSTWDWQTHRRLESRLFDSPVAEMESSPFDSKFAVIRSNFKDSTEVRIHSPGVDKPLARFQVPENGNHTLRFTAKNEAIIFFEGLDPIAFHLDFEKNIVRKTDFPWLKLDIVQDYRPDPNGKQTWLPAYNGLYVQPDKGDTIIQRAAFTFFKSEMFCFDPKFRYVAAAEAPNILKNVSTYTLKVFDLDNGKEQISQIAHQQPVSALSFNNEGRFLATASRDGFLKLWDIAQKREALSMVTDGHKDYIALTPENYYQASKGAHGLLAFEQQGRLMAFEQFDLRFNRPDLVLQKMGIASDTVVKAYYHAFQKRLGKMGFTEAMLGQDFDLPELAILDKDIPLSTVARSLSVQIKATGAQHPLDRINVFINDVPVFGTQGINLRFKNTRQHEQTLALALAPGENKIQISVLNQAGAESLKETFYVTCTAPARKPDLYLVGLGSGVFRNAAALNLKYPTKDVADLARFFEQDNGVYGRVILDTLLDASLTPERLNAIKSKLSKTAVDDCVILFAAGHGLIDESLDYYLATYETDFNQPRHKAIPYETLEALLDGIPARQKLLLLDACHAGEIDKEEVTLVKTQNTSDGAVKFRAFGNHPMPRRLGLENAFELMKTMFIDLRRGAGATVIASAGGAEYAMEGETWNNSVFMYSLLSGLQSKKADVNRDGAITVSELQTYLGAEVEKRTEGRQKPTFRTENVTNDWRLW